MTTNKGLAGRLDKVRLRLRQEGVKSLPAWAWRWIYWNSGIARVKPIDVRAKLGQLRPARPIKHLSPTINEDLRGWCQQHPGCHYEVVRPPQVMVRPKLQTIEATIPDGFTGYYRFEAPPKALVSITGARLVGPNGLLVLPDGSFVGELIANGTLGRRLMLEKEPAYYMALPRRVLHKAGAYFPMFVIGWQNYFHWNHDVITRMHELFERLPPETRFIVPANLRPFQSESLRLVGIGPDRQVPFSGEEVWQLENVYVTIPYPKPAIDTTESLAWYSQRCLSGYGIKPGQPHRRIYISRRFTGHNRNRNEAEVMDCLAQFGFTIVMPEQLTFREQVELFAEAEVVVGDGAGMLNTIFMQPGTHVLNLMPAGYEGYSFWTIAEALGLQFWYLSADIAPDSDPGLAYPDVYVPIHKLRQAVVTMLHPPDWKVT